MVRRIANEPRVLTPRTLDLQAGTQSTVTTDLRTGGRTGCEVSFLRNDEVDP